MWFFQVWINQSDIILVGLRDYQDEKADVILKYTPDEARSLKSYGEIPESAKINDADMGENEDDIITFDDFDGEDDEIDDVSELSCIKQFEKFHLVRWYLWLCLLSYLIIFLLSSTVISQIAVNCSAHPNSFYHFARICFYLNRMYTPSSIFCSQNFSTSALKLAIYICVFKSYIELKKHPELIVSM